MADLLTGPQPATTLSIHRDHLERTRPPGLADRRHACAPSRCWSRRHPLNFRA